MKKAAILCPGPSLPERWDDEKAAFYGDIVAVNRAALYFRAGVVAHLDPKPEFLELPGEHWQQPELHRWTRGAGGLWGDGSRSRYTFPLTLQAVLRGALGYVPDEVGVYGFDAAKAPGLGDPPGKTYGQRWFFECRLVREVWDSERCRHYGAARF